ncbi:MAG: winged helix-turn-helix domain-containing protein, partial [Pseudomonadota bacterium]
PEKRKYGYYVFPLLERDKLIGRVDAQAKRAENLVAATRLWLEPKVKWSKARDEKFQSELVRQSRLCGVKGVDWNMSRIVN